MKKHLRYTWLSGLCLFVFTPVLWAHPPTDIKLSYDYSAKTLHIEMTHVTSNIVKHYIRRLEIVKNQDVPVTMTLPRQTTPHNLVEDVSLTAKPGDTIQVKAYSKEGGIAEQSFIVPPEDSKKKTNN